MVWRGRSASADKVDNLFVQIVLRISVQLPI